jgi:hypothetical protein
MGVNVNEHHGQARGALQQEMGTAQFDETAAFALAHTPPSQRCGSQPRKCLTLGSGAPGAIKEGWQAMIDAALEEK